MNARAEASAWIARLHGPERSPDMEAGFRRWLGERPENAQEFEALTEIWDQSVGAAAVGIPRMAVIPERSRGRPAQPRWMRTALAAAACGVLAFGLYLFVSATRYTTGVGEQRIVLLSDGTRVSLNSNTRLRTAYRDLERHVYLDHGEAFFEVSPDKQRPFVVTAGDRRVTALGTSFMVRYENDRTAVTLVEGKIAVTQVSEGVRVLTPGQRIVVAANDVETLDRPKVQDVTAWRRGEIVLSDTRLDDAAAEMNRYDATRIVVDAPETAALLVSGLYHTGDSEGFAQTVATMHGLELTRESGEIHLKSR